MATSPSYAASYDTDLSFLSFDSPVSFLPLDFDTRRRTSDASDATGKTSISEVSLVESDFDVQYASFGRFVSAEMSISRAATPLLAYGDDSPTMGCFELQRQQNQRFSSGSEVSTVSEIGSSYKSARAPSFCVSTN